MFSTAVLAFLVIFLTNACTLCVANSNFTDRDSLFAFKASIEFDPGNVLSKNWTLNTSFCNWYGVSCSKRRQRVTVLRLPNMGLVGPISPYIGNLSFLSILNLGNNSFHGQIINEIGRLSRLKQLLLRSNNLIGEIPMSLALCQNLYAIDLGINEIAGTLPKNFTTLPNLFYLNLVVNNLTGTLPASFANMSTLEMIGLTQNGFYGNNLNNMALIPRLTQLFLGGNSLTGTIPASLFNISSLVLLSLAGNFFTGELPKDTGLQLPNLSKLFLGGNRLTGTIPSNLYNASMLTLLTIEMNNLTGNLPTLPSSLQTLSAFQCKLQGEIPKGIGNLRNLTFLNLNENRFSGNIPQNIKGMESIQQLSLGYNELKGPIPEDICFLRNLGTIFLTNNRLSGSIPDCIGNLSGLQVLSLGNNGLSSKIPQSLWGLDQLLALGLSSNLLYDDLGKKFSAMKSLNFLDVSRNNLSGFIPDLLGSFQTLTFLDLSWNSFSGPIPESLVKLIILVDLNISNNNLSGIIPKSLETLTSLKHLNLSYNKLSGEIPAGGPFLNFTPRSFMANLELCGKSISKPCPSQVSRKSRNKLFPLSYIIPTIVVVLILIVGALFYVFRKRTRNTSNQNPEKLLQEQRMISYHELSLATNGFSEANFLGSGGFGKVYKGILSDREIVAVKVLNLTVDGAVKSFDAECKVLRTVRHRNIVKVISACTNPELRALVLEYIPNGSLEKWLYSHNYYLNFLQRVNIMLDVAVAMEYLHSGQSEPVIHCDLKPSNVLLDNDMVARVGDFGIAKILAANKTETHTSTLGTFGYIAPEYGGEGRVSTKGDIYSYGIMLLETFTRKRPTDEMFSEKSSLRQWVSSSLPDEISEVIDENLFNENAQERSLVSSKDIISSLFDLGLGCSRDLPEERFEMKDVVIKLSKIKKQILSE